MIAAALSVFPFFFGKLLGDRRRAQTWNPDWLAAPHVVLVYPPIFVGLLLIANALTMKMSDLSLLGLLVNLVIRIATGVLGSLLVSIGKWVRDKAFQKYRDAYAESISNSFVSGKISGIDAFVLYLRPFAIAHRLPIQNPKNGLFIPLPFSADSVDTEVDFEWAFERQVRRVGPVVALGNPTQEADRVEFKPTMRDGKSALSAWRAPRG